MVRLKVRLTEDTDASKLLAGLERRLRDRGVAPERASVVVGAVGEAVTVLTRQARQVAGVGGTFAATRAVTFDDAIVDIRTNFGRRRSLLSRLLGRGG